MAENKSERVTRTNHGGSGRSPFWMRPDICRPSGECDGDGKDIFLVNGEKKVVWNAGDIIFGSMVTRLRNPRPRTIGAPDPSPKS